MMVIACPKNLKIMGTDSNLWTGVCIILLTYTYVYYISSRLTIGQEIFHKFREGYGWEMLEPSWPWSMYM